MRPSFGESDPAVIASRALARAAGYLLMLKPSATGPRAMWRCQALCSTLGRVGPASVARRARR
jgi:hypothetical protein